jgi:serine/threonine-protein kinase
MLEWKWAEAEAYYRRALQLNPGYATSHHWLGCDLLALLGRLDEAMDEVEIAVELDPLSLIILEGRAYIRLLKRQFEGAADQCHAIIKTDPSFYKGHASLGRALIQLGRYDEALAHLGIARRQAGDVPSILGATGQALALRGRRDEARRVLTDLEAMGRRRYVPSTCFALIHAGLGEQEIALDYLKRGVDQREMQVTALMVHPAYDALRTHPRFNALLQRLGFVRTESA